PIVQKYEKKVLSIEGITQFVEYISEDTVKMIKTKAVQFISKLDSVNLYTVSFISTYIVLYQMLTELEKVALEVIQTAGGKKIEKSKDDSAVQTVKFIESLTILSEEMVRQKISVLRNKI